MNYEVPIETLRTLYERDEKIVLLNQHGKSVVCTESRKHAAKNMQVIDELIRPQQAEPGRGT